MDLLPQAAKKALKSSWKTEDEPIQMALYYLVSNHYESDHLAQYRVHAFESHPLKWRIDDNYLGQGGQMKGGIKVEEKSQPLRRSNRPPCPRRMSD